MVIALAYIFYFVSSTASKLQRRHIAIKRDTDEGQIDFAFRVMAITFVLSPVLLLFKPFEFNQPAVTILALAMVCGIFGASAISAQYIAQRHTEAGVTSLLGSSYAPMTILLATIILNEGLETRQVLGTILLLIAVVLVSQKHRLSKWRFDRYFWLNIFSGVALSFTLTAERSLIKENGITTGTLVSWGATTFFLGAAAALARAKSQHHTQETLTTGGLRFMQQLSWVVLVTVVANLSLVSAVATFSTTVTFVAAAIFIHEREDFRRKIIGSFFATVGLLLMI
ncbi:hypothetical protein A3F65_02395 [Candidatus Saccharibacteria bacterium RIFCSPHIGHO2_12_FULL_47_16b]|nr:MAG: hypothetical protein A3F65_02395 [Candidatus Saccharibacteria bacterium RIFCSPHIGHO2_12_FULL_47_16b]